MKRVLVIAATPFYLEKGSSLRVYSVLKQLTSRYQVDLITYAIGSQPDLKNLKIHRTPPWFKPKIGVSNLSIKKMILDFLVLFKSLWLVLSNDYDIIHCEDFEAAAIGSLLSPFIRKKKRIYDLHNRISDNLAIKGRRLLGQWVKPLERLITKTFDLIMVNWSHYLQQKLLKKKTKFLFYDQIKTKVKEVDEFNLDDYLVYAGNFEKYQGVEEFLKVFSDVETDYQLVLVGQPTEKIKQLIQEKNLDQRVKLLGQLSFEQTNYIIKNALAAIAPRSYGKQPSMKLVHYLYWEKPIIASEIPANLVLLKNSYNSWLYKDKKDLKRLLKKLDSEKTNLIKPLLTGIKQTKQKITQTWTEDYFFKKYEQTTI
jgi:glycosyltransferase involved in cell wall biosynthesis